MAILNKKVDMLVWFRADGIPMPLKFRYAENEKELTVKVDNIISAEKQTRGGENVYIYDCQTLKNDRIVRFILRYLVGSCEWYLYKI